MTSGMKRSNLDRKLREDFYNSKVVILFLGKIQGQENSIENHWMLPELKYALSHGIPCFVYTTSEVSEEEIKSLVLPLLEVSTVRDPDHFAATLRQNLTQLML